MRATINIDDELYAVASKFAKSEQLSFSAFGVKLITDKLEAEGHLPETSDEERVIEKVRVVLKEGATVDQINNALGRVLLEEPAA